jgi:hypothetical protein
MVAIVHHILKIEGPRVACGRPAPAAIGEVLRQVEFAAKESVRMGFRRSSRKPGRVPEWLRAAEDIRFVDLSGEGDATLLHFEAPKFGDVADEPYRQPTLFDQPPPQTDTAFDLLGDIIGDVAARLADSERFDLGLLQRFERFNAAFRRGVNSVAVLGDRLSSERPPCIDAKLAEDAASLHRETPAPQRVRICGKLDMIRDSDRVFNLILSAGERLRGVWTGGDTKQLADFFKASVVIGGTAVFRPSGRLLRVDAEAIDIAADNDVFFSTMPQPTRRAPDIRELSRKQKTRGGLSMIFGKWPGDETEAELLAALKEMG